MADARVVARLNLPSWKRELNSFGSLAVAPDTAAALVGLPRAAMDREISRAHIPVHYVGAEPLILVDDLRAWLTSLPTEPPARRN